MMPDQTTYQLNCDDKDIWVGSTNDRSIELTVDGPEENKARIARIVVRLELDEAEWIREAIQKKSREIQEFQRTPKAKTNG